MKRFAQFLSKGMMTEEPIELLGSDGVLPLDARLSLDNQVNVALKQAVQLNNLGKGVIGFEIRAGSRFSESKLISKSMLVLFHKHEFKRNALKMEATECCLFRKHQIVWEKSEEHTNRMTQNGKCAHCDMWVRINTNPLPNDIDISGTAVALNCKDRWHHIVKTSE